MSNNAMDGFGLSTEDIQNAESSAIAKVFEPLPSGVYEATVEDVVVYKNQWDGKMARYTVIIKDDKGEDRTVSFRRDIGQLLQSGKPNHGYAGRLEQFSHATATPIAEMSMGQETTFKSFGKDIKGTLVVGMKGKKLKALVRLTSDTNKEEGQSFKYTNDLQAVVALDGTQKDGEDAVAPFTKAIETKPVFEVQGKTGTKSKTGNEATKTSSGDDVNDLL